MSMQHNIYDMREEIKTVVISIQEYRVRRELMPQGYRYSVSSEEKEDLVKMAERSAKHQILDGLEQFIHCEFDENRNFVEAQIWMPYVKDAVVKSLEETEKYQQSRIAELSWENNNMQKRIDYLELPWWKKLWLKVSD